MNPNFVLNLDDSQDYQNFQSYETSQFFANPNQFPITENVQTSQNTGKNPRGDKWDVDEDIALMSAYCIVSEDERRGKNQKKTSIWAQVKELYDANQAENPRKIGNRNIAQMKGRYKRLNESAGKWVGVYREAYRKRRSGMSMKDVENEAHKLYETSGSKFNDTIVFNEVMCKHRKRDLLVEGAISCFREEYLRSPNRDDLARLLHVGEERGFPVLSPLPFQLALEPIVGEEEDDVVVSVIYKVDGRKVFPREQFKQQQSCRGGLSVVVLERRR
ncbi:unnamed protein product [Lactuca virosa]|uniref:Myb/SANT-like domain-containing protein n=1 Tax=Lactuca virosa TaxID=75947 RepID=A0AAU9PN36_9ASTR|nr:unnamed protein product [Lactuca virosa]